VKHRCTKAKKVEGAFSGAFADVAPTKRFLLETSGLESLEGGSPDVLEWEVEHDGEWLRPGRAYPYAGYSNKGEQLEISS
jgi:hypothetical protein